MAAPGDVAREASDRIDEVVQRPRSGPAAGGKAALASRKVTGQVRPSTQSKCPEKTGMRVIPKVDGSVCHLLNGEHPIVIQRLSGTHGVRHRVETIDDATVAQERELVGIGPKKVG